MILGASGPLVSIKVWHLEFWRDENIGYQAQVHHIGKWVVTEPFNSSQSLFDEIEFSFSFCCRRQSSHKEEKWLHSAGLRDSCNVALRQCIRRQSLGGKRGVGVDVPVGALPWVLVDIAGGLRRLPFRSNRSGMIHVVMHSWWC